MKELSIGQKAVEYGAANQAFMLKNGIKQKQWVAAGNNPCNACSANAARGPIPVEDKFQSGQLHEPAHAGCECYVQGVGPDLTVMSNTELASLVIWDKDR